MTGEPMTFAHTCQGTIALMAENDRLSKALAERDETIALLRAEGADERAERAVMSNADAYRLVEEARQMREERDYQAAANEQIREALWGVVNCRRWLGCFEHGGKAREVLAAAPGAPSAEPASGGSATPDGREGEG
jgi:hypothetical protein